MRFQPPPSTQGYQLGTRRVRPEQARHALLSSASAASRFPQPPARGKSSTRAGKKSDRGQAAKDPPPPRGPPQRSARLSVSAPKKRRGYICRTRFLAFSTPLQGKRKD